MYPIEKKLVIGATKISDGSYARLAELGWLNDIQIWTLTTDDYVVALDKNATFIDKNDMAPFLFICY